MGCGLYKKAIFQAQITSNSIIRVEFNFFILMVLKSFRCWFGGGLVNWLLWFIHELPDSIPDSM